MNRKKKFVIIALVVFALLSIVIFFVNRHSSAPDTGSSNPVSRLNSSHAPKSSGSVPSKSITASSRDSAVGDAEMFLHRFYDRSAYLPDTAIKAAVQKYTTDSVFGSLLSDMGEISSVKKSVTQSQPDVTLSVKTVRSYLHKLPDGEQNVLVYYTKMSSGKKVSASANYVACFNMQYNASLQHWIVSKVEANKYVNFYLGIFPQG